MVHKSARNKDKSDLEEMLYPLIDKLKSLYSFWLKFPFWTADEAAALLIGADPRQVAAFYILPVAYREKLKEVTNLIHQKFPDDKVSPSALRDYAPTIGVVNDLLWSADPSEKKPARKSSETLKENTRNKIAYGLALRYGYRSGNRTNVAVGTIQRRLEEVGISITDDTIRDHLRELAQDPVLARIEADLCAAKNKISRG
jgi:hypothetical protein